MSRNLTRGRLSRCMRPGFFALVFMLMMTVGLARHFA